MFCLIAAHHDGLFGGEALSRSPLGVVDHWLESAKAAVACLKPSGVRFQIALARGRAIMNLL